MRKQIVKTIFENIQDADFTVKYWDGEEVQYGSGESKVKIIFNEPLPVNFNLENPVLAFGEAYMDEIMDIEGSMDEVIKILNKNRNTLKSGVYNTLNTMYKTLNKVAMTIKQKENIQHHYDLGNDFFSLWLDETMCYSCAYFENETDTLHQAQLQKIDHILKKLNLQPGQRLLDIGSGWGWLIIRAAQKYNVKALGITLSEEQYRGTKERIEKYGLADIVEVRLQDYLELDEKTDQFDRIVSVGMFEHVGKENLSKYMETVERLLTPGGISLLHTITGTKEEGVNAWMDKYIFPGSYIPSLREIIWFFPDYDFHLLHAESLRLHYAMTLDRWHENFKQYEGEFEQKYGRRFTRMWDLYLKGCAASFRVANLNIYQLLFSKGYNNDISMTFDYIYND